MHIMAGAPALVAWHACEVSRCLVTAATVSPPPTSMPSFAQNTCLNPDLFFFQSLATLDHLSVVSFILFMTTSSPSPLELPYVSFFVTAHPLPFPSPTLPLLYCLFKFAVWIVLPSSAASPVIEHRCNYAPIISITRPRHTNTQAVRQAGRVASSRTHKCLGCKISPKKTRTKKNIADCRCNGDGGRKCGCVGMERGEGGEVRRGGGEKRLRARGHCVFWQPQLTDTSKYTGRPRTRVSSQRRRRRWQTQGKETSDSLCKCRSQLLQPCRGVDE